jgi:site-specific recombinase XerD
MDVTIGSELAIRRGDELLLFDETPATNPLMVFLASKSKHSRINYECDLRTIARLLGLDDPFLVDWGALTYAHTQAIRTALMETVANRTGKPLKSSTINRMLSALRGVLRVSWRLGYMDGETYQRAVDLEPVIGKSLPAGRLLSPDELAALIDVCQQDTSPKGARDAAIITLAYCGLRRTELASLDVGDYTPSDGRLLVKGKRRKERSIYLVTGADDILDDWLSVRASVDGNDKNKPLFLAISRYGEIRPAKRLSSQAIHDAFRKRSKQAKVQCSGIHDLRRTWISNLLEEGADIAVVARLAGHASVTTTARYDRRGKKAERSAAHLLTIPQSKHNGKGG